MKKPRKTKNPHVGSTFDEFLKGEGIFEELQEQAIKEVEAFRKAVAEGDAQLDGGEGVEYSRALVNKLTEAALKSGGDKEKRRTPKRRYKPKLT